MEILPGNLTIYRLRNENAVAKNLIFSTMFAFLTAIGAMIRIYTPFTPVPFTMQVFFVLLGGIVLGKYYGALSQIIYATFGIIGIPWFASSIHITGGYIAGFIFASFLVGYITEQKKFRKYPYNLFPLLTGIAVIYTCGSLHFSLLTGYEFMKTIELAVLPFIPFDIAKAMAVSVIAR